MVYMTKISRDKYRKTGFILMLAACVSFLAVNLTYWSVLITECGESPILSAIVISLFFASIPFAIVLITYYLPPAGSVITIAISILMLAYWIIALFSDSIRTNPILVYGGIPSSIIFLAGGIFLLMDSVNSKK